MRDAFSPALIGQVRTKYSVHAVTFTEKTDWWKRGVLP